MAPGAKLRYGADMGTRNTLALLLVTACQASPIGHTGFGSTPDISTGPAASTGEGSTSSSSSGTSTGNDGGSAGGSADTTTEPVRDLGGMPDFGNDSPVGCKGKIDFLFVIARNANMGHRQEQLTAAFPHFIDTIKSKFADFDYHIMVVTGDDWWGNPACTELCATPGCSVGDQCCDWNDPDQQGEPCCTAPDYPCQELDLVSECDRTWGAGEVFPAGVGGEPNKPCPIDGGRRYLVKGQSDLDATFACIATVGTSGWGSLGQAMVAALQKPINEPGGCNKGFLREDALLMVTFIAANPDQKQSEGTPAEWAQAVLDAKHGDERSVVMLYIGVPGCQEADRLCELTKMFPFHHPASLAAPDLGPVFAEAASLVEVACAEFVPPPG